jgi:biotin operon repressor
LHGHGVARYLSDMVRPREVKPRAKRARASPGRGRAVFPTAAGAHDAAACPASGKKFPNCRKLAHELEVSEKTIQRDIEFMRYQLGLPIEYDQLHFGFVYTEPVTSFPNIQVSEGEIVALFVAQKATPAISRHAIRKAAAGCLRQDRARSQGPDQLQLE